jgi:hypothetical protein
LPSPIVWRSQIFQEQADLSEGLEQQVSDFLTQAIELEIDSF